MEKKHDTQEIKTSTKYAGPCWFCREKMVPGKPAFYCAGLPPARKMRHRDEKCSARILGETQDAPAWALSVIAALKLQDALGYPPPPTLDKHDSVSQGQDGKQDRRDDGQDTHNIHQKDARQDDESQDANDAHDARGQQDSQQDAKDEQDRQPPPSGSQIDLLDKLMAQVLKAKSESRAEVDSMDAKRQTEIMSTIGAMVNAALSKMDARDSGQSKRQEKIVIHKIEVNGNDVTSNIPTPHKMLPDMLRALTAKTPEGRHVNVWVTGPSGSGKTQAAEQAAQALGMNYQLIACSIDTTAQDIVGFVRPDGIPTDTPFTDWVRFGGLLLIDEATAARDAVVTLNAALSNKYIPLPGRGMVKVHDTCFAVAADNTWGTGPTAEYTSRGKVDLAFTARFGCRMFWDYDPDMERAATGDHPMTRKLQRLREFIDERKVKGCIVSLRQMQSAIALLNAGFEESRVLGMCVTAGLSPETARSLTEHWSTL